MNKFKHVKSFPKYHEENDKTWPIESIRPMQASAYKCANCEEYYDIVYDEIHGEIVCKKCGYVIQSNIAI